MGFPEIFRHFYGFNLDSFKGFNGFSVGIFEDLYIWGFFGGVYDMFWNDFLVFYIQHVCCPKNVWRLIMVLENFVPRPWLEPILYFLSEMT